MTNRRKDKQGIAVAGRSGAAVELPAHSGPHIALPSVRQPLPLSAERSVPSKAYCMPRNKPVSADLCHHKSAQMSDGDELSCIRIAVWAAVFEAAVAITAAVCWKLWMLLR